MGIELGYNVLKEAFYGWSLFGTTWLIPLVVVLLSIVWITRDTQKWKELGLIMIVGWQITGMPIPWFITTIAGLIYILEHISFEQLGTIIESATGIIGSKVDERLKTRKVQDLNKLEQYKVGNIKNLSIKDIKNYSSQGYEMVKKPSNSINGEYVLPITKKKEIKQSEQRKIQEKEYQRLQNIKIRNRANTVQPAKTNIRNPNWSVKDPNRFSITKEFVEQIKKENPYNAGEERLSREEILKKRKKKSLEIFN